ncbi:hypothetical protein LCGC14_0342920 [marine sediment metagenome]|uniref:Uncharacterized protein n=1 Tax=marine sediment metagenome TaxID=412755 RepID=A0A0F9TIL9_9ZZZZ
MITRFKFRKAMGEWPKYDDMGRVNCIKEGSRHTYCGWCKECDKPRMQCGCRRKKK